MTIALLVASWVFWLTIGFLLGLYADNRVYRIPEHPVLRPRQPRWRVIQGGKQSVYDQDEGRSV